MGATYRRVILKPAGLTDSDGAQLAEKLADAVEWQQALSARSPHVLQFVGGLQETESTFFVEHEPATPTLATATLFDSSPPPLDEKQLLRIAVALFDALRAAHGMTGRRLRAHGGLCPGVVLASPDGIEKSTDFGFAPALCAVLGVDSYLNLALGTGIEDVPNLQGTGIWEVLSVEVLDRGDRICSFIDPEKYGMGTQETFEPGSDIIAAGFILHLMAEHRHPYLPDPDAHRMVEMSEFMSMARYNGARRKDLRESADPAVALWCKLVEDTLSRLPQNRPTAQEAGAALGQYVKPVDAGEILRRRLEAAADLVNQGKWEELHRTVKGIAENEAAPPEVIERANALLSQADANILLERAVDVLKGESWRDAKEPLDAVLALPALPGELAERAKKASGVLEHNLALQRQLDEIQARIQQHKGADLTATQSLLEDSVARLDEFGADESSLPLLQAYRARLRDELASRLKEVAAEIERLEAKRREEAERLERERRADREEAERWLANLQSALDAVEWEAVQKLLGDRPQLKHWPDGAEKRAADIERRLTEHVAEQRRLAAIRADHEKANAWIQRVREAVQAEAWDQAEQVLGDKPQLTYWPDDVLTEAKESTKRVADVRQQQADFEQARKWRDDLKSAVEGKQWSKAADAISNRPTLTHWPKGVLDDESPLRTEVEKQLEAIELERRQIAAWMQSANQAIEAKHWDEALRILESPPVGIDRLGEDVRRQADALRQSCTAKREAEIKRRRDERVRAVHAAAGEFVRDVVARNLRRFIDPARVQITVEAEQFVNPEVCDEGTAQLSHALTGWEAGPTVGGGTEPAGAGGIPRRFSFRVEDGVTRICDDDRKLDTDLISELTKDLIKLQKERVTDLASPLRKGAFSRIQVAVGLDEPTERVKATFCLLGPNVSKAEVPTELVWDPSALTWSHDDAAGFTQHALGIAAKATREVVEAKLPQESDELQRYKSALSLEVVPGRLPDPTVLPASLPLEGRLTIRPGGGGEPKLLCVFTLTCSQVGQVPPDTDTEAAAVNLKQMIAAAQNSSRDGLRAQLQKRLDRSPVKVKLKLLPRRITDPVDEIRFELDRKRREAVTLTARWDSDEFTYAASDGWQDALDMALAPPAPGEERSRGFMPVAVGAAALVIIVAGGYALLRGSDQAPKVAVVGPVENVNDNAREEPDEAEERAANANDNEVEPDEDTPEANANESPVDAAADDSTLSDNDDESPPPVPSADEALADVREILRRSAHLQQWAAHLVSVTDHAGAAQAVITCRLPGLENPGQTVELEPSEDGTAWTLPEQDRQEIETRVTQLDNLLRLQQEDAMTGVNRAIADALEEAEYDRFLDPANVKFLVEPPQEWTLSESQDRWLAEQVAGSIVLAGVSEPLVSFGPGLELIDETIRLSDTVARGELMEGLMEQVGVELARRQNESMLERKDQLETKVGSIAEVAGASVPVSQPREVIELTVGAPRLQRRDFTATWRRDELSFVFDEINGKSWTDRADELLLAFSVIDRLNTRAGARDDWLGRGSSGPVTELSEPDEEGAWTLGAAPPWVEPQEIADLAPEDLLPIEVSVASFGGRRADDLARFIVQDAQQPPYWPLIDRYLTYTADASRAFFLEGFERELFLAALDDAEGEAGLGLTVLDYLRSNPSYCGVQMEIAGEPTLRRSTEDAPPDMLQIPFAGRWGIKEAPQVAAADVLRDAIHRLMQPSGCILLLSISDTGNVVPLWREVGDLLAALESDAPRIAELERQLTQLPARAALESELQSMLGEQDQVDLYGREDEGLALLSEIWSIKGVTPPRVDDFPQLISRLRDRRRGVRFDKSRALRSTVFAEYFCGPTSCYVIVGSAGINDTSLQEGPVLRRLCPIDGLVVPLGAAPEVELGQNLIGSALAAVPNARKADTLGPFNGRLAVTIAPDDAMSVVDIRELQFEPVQALLSLIDPASGVLPNARFDSLNALREDTTGLMCDYRLVSALCAPRSTWQPIGSGSEAEARQWALKMLAAAGEPAE